MLSLPLIVALCVAPLSLAQPDPFSTATDVRTAAKTRAFEAIATGDPVAGLSAVSDALLMSPDDAELIAARERLIPDAVPSAISRATELLALDQPAQAVELLADIRAASADERLIEPLAEARAINLLHEAASHEAAGRAEAAARMIILAANIRPQDPAVLAALARNNLTPPPRPTVDRSAPDEPADAPAPTTLPATGPTRESLLRGSLEQDVNQLNRRLDELTLQIARMDRDLTIPATRGAADSAVTQLDRRVSDLQRSLDRAIADLSRQVSTLSRDVDTLRRDSLRRR